jgi:hypothetical protein
MIYFPDTIGDTASAKKQDAYSAGRASSESQGYKLLVATRKEPWGQVVTRLLGPEGLLVGITHTPSMRK